MNKEGVNVYKREKLYEEVWNEPVTHVAKKYGVSNVAIKKICKSMNIPTPPNGYWAKLMNGKEVEKIPLPPASDGLSIKYGIKPLNPNAIINKGNDNALSFLTSEEQEQLFNVASSLKIDHKKKPSEEILKHRKIVDDWNNKHYSIEGTAYRYSDFVRTRSTNNNGKYVVVPLLAGTLSDDGLKRAYKIIDALITGIIQLGFSVNSDMSFNIRGEVVKFVLYEKRDKTKHIITSKEEKTLRDYNKNPMGYKPIIPLYDYQFSGKLAFNTKTNAYIRDTDKYALEDRLADMLIQLVEQSEIIRKDRLRREEEQRRKEEEERLRKLSIELHNLEVDKLTALFRELSDFDIATKIRNYVNYVQQKDVRHEKSDWIVWAKEKADWYDPTVDKMDSIFGKREHSSDAIPEKKGVVTGGSNLILIKTI